MNAAGGNSVRVWNPQAVDGGLTDRRNGAVHPLVVLLSVAAATLAALLIVDELQGQLLVAVLACLAACALLLGYEALRTGDLLNGATFLLLPVALGFAARGISLLVADGELRYPAWISIAERDQLASAALWTATAGVVALYVGYRIGFSAGGRAPHRPRRIISPRRTRLAVLVLAIVGVTSFVVLLYKLGGLSFFERIAYAREETAGLGTLKFFEKGARLAVFIWMATAERLTARKVVLVTAGLLLMTTGQRSQVFGIVIPALIIYHHRVKRISIPAITGIALFCIVVTIGFVEYRQYTRSVALETREIGGATIVDPTPPAAGSSSIFRTALVSLDGLVFVQQVYPDREPPTWGKDLRRVIQGFIPRQIWPDKPQWLGAELSNRYLNFRNSGIFISGFGYLWAVGLFPGVIAGSLLIGLALGSLYARMRATKAVSWLVVYALTAVTAARFQLAGDAVTFFFYLQALVPALIVLYLITIRAAPEERRGAIGPVATDRRSKPAFGLPR